MRTLSALQQRLAQLESANRPSPAERCELALLRVLTGRSDDAVTLLEKVVSDQPRNVEAMIALLRIHWREGRSREIGELFRRATAANRNHPAVRVQEAENAAAWRSPAEALALFQKIVAEQPRYVDALAGLARLQVRLGRSPDALQTLDRALEVDSQFAYAHLLKSEIHLRALNEEARLESAHHALAADSLLAEAQLAVSAIMRQKGEVANAYQRLLAVLAFDPTHLEAHRTLGNGGALKSWGRYPTLEDDSVPPELARRLDVADSLLVVRSLDHAESAFKTILGTNPGLAAARLGLASARFYHGDYENAYRQFLEIARDHPGLGLAHYGVSESLKRIRIVNNPRTVDALTRFQSMPRPAEPERLRDVFTDFNLLDTQLQKIVLVSVAPLSNYMPILALAGGKHHLMPFHHRLWNWEGTAASRGQRAFDGRLWDDVKGQGGRNAVAGEEPTREVVLGRYNVLAHEFMHQVHALLTPEQRATINAMYQSARRERRTLDPYADSNPNEYIAQAYEAFVTGFKESGQTGMNGNTRERLRQIDPAAFTFLEQLNAQTNYRQLALLALTQRLNGRGTLEPASLDGIERDTEWVLTRYGAHPDVFALQADLARLRGQFERAAEVHTRAIASAPELFGNYVALADDYVLAGHDHKRAADVITQYMQRDSSSFDAWLALARYQLAAGALQPAQRALEKAEALQVKPAGAQVEANLLRAEHARLSGDYSAARRYYRQVADTIQPRNVRARAELTLLAVRDGQLAQALAWLPAGDSARADPLALEAQARVMAINGRGLDGLRALVGLRAAEPARLETITAMIAVARTVRPTQVPGLIVEGRQLIEQKAPVKTAYVQGRFVQRSGVLTARARAEFEAEAARK